MAKLAMHLGTMGGKPSKFRLPYSRTPNFQLPEFIPKDKRKGELTVAMYYCMALINLKRNIEGVALNEDDSDKQADVIVYEDGKKQYIQITRLTFTDFERRKSHNNKTAIEFATTIQNKVQVDFVLIVNLFPKEKHRVPLDQLKKRRRASIENNLVDFVAKCIKDNIDLLRKAEENISFHKLDSELSQFYDGIDLLPVPKGFYPNVPGLNNVYVNYKFYDSTYDDSDIEKEVDRIYHAKNDGHSEVLLIWANGHELLDEGKIVKALRTKFIRTSFDAVYFMIIHLNVKIFIIKATLPSK